MDATWSHLFRGALNVRTRSSALHPLLWALGVILLFAVGGHVLGLAEPMTWALLVLAVLVTLAILVSYFFFMLRAPHNLRSERHAEKMAQLALLGDSSAGLRGEPPILALENSTDAPELHGSTE